MSIVIIDAEKCKKDGLCVRECPFMLIQQPNADTVPYTGGGAEKICMRCGHCVAVCPHGALSLKDMPAESCMPIEKENMIDVVQIEQFMKSRRSIRAFKSKEAPSEDIEKLIELAAYAPTAHNDEEVEWVVINGAENVKRIAQLTVDAMRELIEKHPESPMKKSLQLLVGVWDMGMDVILRRAPHVLVAHAEYGKSPFSEFYPADCATAIAYIELAAPGFGLGTCWSGMLVSVIQQSETLKKALGVPENNRCLGALMMGYPNVKHYRIPLRKPPQIIWHD